MDGISKYYGNKTVPVSLIEELFMRSILLTERIFATAKVYGDSDRASCHLAQLKILKKLFRQTMECSKVSLTKEASEWASHEDTYEDYCYIGEWAGFWYKWKNGIQFDVGTEKFTLPLSSPELNFMYCCLAGSCDTCMFRIFGEDAKCLPGVRESFHDMTMYDTFPCSHYVADELPEYNSDPVEEELPETDFKDINTRHLEYYKKVGSPEWDPEESRIPTQADLDAVLPKRFKNEQKEDNI